MFGLHVSLKYCDWLGLFLYGSKHLNLIIKPHIYYVF